MSKINWKEIKYFTKKEFDDPSFEDSGDNIDRILLDLLISLREKSGWPIITHCKVGGCVDMKGYHGHAQNSYHLFRYGAKACDFHFDTTAPVREQFYMVTRLPFTGLGVYYDWSFNNIKLPVGFHVDLRPEKVTQFWIRDNKKYSYFLK